MRLLIIDDDAELCGLLGQYLGREGDFEVEFAHTGAAGIERHRKGGIDLIVLDVMLPGIDGFEVLRAIRKEGNVPVIMLTARGEDVDRIVGLELGADDYMPKPFNPRELVARIKAVLRRQQQPVQLSERIEVGTTSIDTGAREVRCAGRLIELTTLEFDILELLMRAAGRILTRDHIMERLYDRTSGPFDRSIDMHVSHLRKKLGGCAESIKTIRGSGYQFVRTSGSGDR
jgi:two-component system response regulator CpxR